MTAVPGSRAVGVRRAPATRRTLRALIGWRLRDNRRSPLTWGGSLGVTSALVAAIYPSVQDSTAKLLDSYPEGLKQALGISRLDTIEAYMHAEMFSLVIPVAIAVFAVRCASAPVAAAEERGQLDTLLSTPLSRRTLVTATFGATALAIPAVLVVCGLLTFVASLIAGEALSLGALAQALVGVWALGLFFCGCALAAAGAAHRSAPVTASCVGLIVAMYLLDVVGKLSDPLADARVLSAFRHLGEPLLSGLDVIAAAGLVLVGALLAGLGAVAFERRDVLG